MTHVKRMKRISKEISRFFSEADGITYPGVVTDGDGDSRKIAPAIPRKGSEKEKKRKKYSYIFIYIIY